MRVSATLKYAIWDLYIGSSVKKTVCPICNVNVLTRNENSGYEAAHIIARRFFVGDLSVYYAYPTCNVCNNQCVDMCLIDFMYIRGNLHALRKFIVSIYRAYICEFEHTLALEDRYSWRILQHLYGSERFSAGGGIENTKAIYEIARTEELHLLTEEAERTAKKLREISDKMCVVAQTKILPTKFGF